MNFIALKDENNYKNTKGNVVEFLKRINKCRFEKLKEHIKHKA